MSLLSWLSLVIFCRYAASKAALNSLIRKIQYEHPELIVFSLHPGTCVSPYSRIWLTSFRIDTDMGQAGFKSMGRDPKDLIEASLAAFNIIKRVEDATMENSGGKFLDANEDKEWPW